MHFFEFLENEVFGFVIYFMKFICGILVSSTNSGGLVTGYTARLPRSIDHWKKVAEM